MNELHATPLAFVEDLAFQQKLVAMGILVAVRYPLPPDQQRPEHPPIRIEGRPISEELLEARR